MYMCMCVIFLFSSLVLLLCNIGYVIFHYLSNKISKEECRSARTMNITNWLKESTFLGKGLAKVNMDHSCLMLDRNQLCKFANLTRVDSGSFVTSTWLSRTVSQNFLLCVFPARVGHNRHFLTRFGGLKWSSSHLTFYDGRQGRSFCRSHTLSLTYRLASSTWAAGRPAPVPPSPGYFRSFSDAWARRVWAPWWRVLFLPHDIHFINQCWRQWELTTGASVSLWVQLMFVGSAWVRWFPPHAGSFQLSPTFPHFTSFLPLCLSWRVLASDVCETPCLDSLFNLLPQLHKITSL